MHFFYPLLKSRSYQCTVTGISFSRPSEQAVCAYVAYLARNNLIHSTVQQYMKGLRDYFVRAGYTDFASRAHWPELYRTLKGVKRADHSGSAQELPISPDILVAYRRGLDVTKPANAAIWACVLVMFFGFFRKSNTTVAGGAPDAQGKCLRVLDVVFHERAYALVVAAPGSKTRQFGPAPTIWIAGRSQHLLDPVQTRRGHVALSGLVDSRLGPCQAFSFLGQDCRQPMRHSHLVAAAKNMATLVGNHPSEVSGHSFRRGGASFAFHAGVPDILIQRQGDWVSACYREYITLTRDRALSATRAMLDLAKTHTDGVGRAAHLVVADEPILHVDASAVRSVSVFGGTGGPPVVQIGGERWLPDGSWPRLLWAWGKKPLEPIGFEPETSRSEVA